MEIFKRASALKVGHALAGMNRCGGLGWKVIAGGFWLSAGQVTPGT
ncbi:hypothetical protein [Azospirillum endophyticum]